MGKGEIYYVPVSHRRLGCCLGLSPPYLVVACVLFWIYRNGTPKMNT
jgi:hypothetical protein